MPPSAVRYASHGRPHAAMVGWLVTYATATPGVHVVDNATLRLDGDNDLQPDAALLIDPGSGGLTRVSADDYLEGAPELVVEVAASSVSLDLGDKLAVYQRNGVREYLVWRVPDGRIDWFELARGAYRTRSADAAGGGPERGVPRLVAGHRRDVARRSCRRPAHAAPRTGRSRPRAFRVRFAQLASVLMSGAHPGTTGDPSGASPTAAPAPRRCRREARAARKPHRRALRPHPVCHLRVAGPDPRVRPAGGLGRPPVASGMAELAHGARTGLRPRALAGRPRARRVAEAERRHAPGRGGPGGTARRSRWNVGRQRGRVRAASAPR